jgi:hypothetical protein
MGLDVYLVWPNITEQEKQAQITGFQNAGNAGYLRRSWGSLRAWDEVFRGVFGISWSDMLFPGWNGSNDGEGPDLSDEKERERLIKNRDLLLAFIQNPASTPDTVRRYFRDWNKAVDIIKSEAQDMVDFINLALSKENARIMFC